MVKERRTALRTQVGFSFSDHFEKKGTEKDIQNIWQLGAKSADLVRERVSEFSIDCDLKEGFIDVATNRKHMEELIDRSEEWKQSGYHHNLELVDENQVKKYVNSDSYVGGLIDSGSGHIHPSIFVWEKQRQLQNLEL